MHHLTVGLVGVEIWWRFTAVVAALLAAILLYVLRRSIKNGRNLYQHLLELDIQVTTLHRAVAEQQAARRELAHRSTHDPLTGLPNRSALIEHLNSTLPTTAVLLVDLDGFTETNDAMGPEIADEILIEVARRIKDTVRHVDLVARLGRDEFAILIPDATHQRARLSAIRVMDALRSSYKVDGHKIRITVSIGMLTPGYHHSAAEALRDADLALSAARSSGRDKLAEFTPELREARLRRARLAAGLRQALDCDEVVLHYQPIVALDTGKPVAFEALARWTPGDGQPIPPSHFIPVAEQTGLVIPLGARVLREACAQGRGWHERYGTAMAVNISGRQLLEPDFAEYVLAVLSDTGLPGDGLILEITETVMVASTGPDGQAIISRLDRLRSHGVRVAIDDFGTGYSSLSYLHRLPIDILKIDGEFTKTLEPSTSNTHIHTPKGRNDATNFARAILRLGLSLELETIAEGVETHHQAESLRVMGCPLVQGFLFARPAPADKAEQHLIWHHDRISA